MNSMKRTGGRTWSRIGDSKAQQTVEFDIWEALVQTGFRNQKSENFTAWSPFILGPMRQRTFGCPYLSTHANHVSVS